MASDTIVNERKESPDKFADPAPFNGPDNSPAFKVLVPIKKCKEVRKCPSDAVNVPTGIDPDDDISTALISGCHEPCNKGTDAHTEVTNCPSCDSNPKKNAPVPTDAFGRAGDLC